MADLIYNSAVHDSARGLIDFDTDTFKAMLVTSSYTADKDIHDRRNDVAHEVTGTGYTAGGVTVACTVALDTSNDKVTLTFAAHSWTTSTITARAEVIYKSRGGSANDDELVYYNDFGADVSTTGGTFSVASSVITLQN
jgi:hypothetical protein